MGRVYGYARVSSNEQHLDRQIEVLTKYGVEDRFIITDKISGKRLFSSRIPSFKKSAFKVRRHFSYQRIGQAWT